MQAQKSPLPLWRTVIGFGALSMAIAICLGAFGAHGLSRVLSAHSKEIYEKAVLYHYLHSLALIILGSLIKIEVVSAVAAKITYNFFCVGILFFCGSLYALAISGVGILGAITPIGGVAFILGWVYLGVKVGKV